MLAPRQQTAVLPVTGKFRAGRRASTCPTAQLRSLQQKLKRLNSERNGRSLEKAPPIMPPQLAPPSTPDFEQGVEASEQSSMPGPDFKRGIEAHEQRNFEEAEAAYRDALLHEEKTEPVLFKLGCLLQEMQLYEGAVQVFEQIFRCPDEEGDGGAHHFHSHSCAAELLACNLGTCFNLAL
jgi:tetratricopeptide (TPR) repeat protein